MEVKKWKWKNTKVKNTKVKKREGNEDNEKKMKIMRVYTFKKICDDNVKVLLAMIASIKWFI